MAPPLNFKAALAALLGLSTYQRAEPRASSVRIDDPSVEAARARMGGQISPLPRTQTRWYQSDVENAVARADTGDMSPMARLWRSIQRDGAVRGLLSTRTHGLVSLPKRFYGDGEIVDALEARNGTRSVYDDMLPPAELAQLDADGIGPGVGVGELLPVEGRDYPVLCRLEPEFLRYNWSENRWYFSSIHGLLPITPGDGRWVLHTPGGRMAPWQHGQWMALGRAWVNKDHAFMHRANWEAKLANPARYARSPIGAGEVARTGVVQALIQWGINTVFELPQGWEVGLLESNGRGYESYQATIDASNLEFMLCLAGQTVTIDGGTGFANADVHRSIRADLIKGDADALAYTINTQCLPQWIVNRWGIGKLRQGAIVEYDVTPPRDLKAAAESLNQMGQAIMSLTTALQPYDLRLDAPQLTKRYDVPVLRAPLAAEDEGEDFADEGRSALQ